VPPLTIASRQAVPRRGAVAEALADGTLVKTWAMRGTLLKPLAWWRVLRFGPPRGNRVTFVGADRLPAVPDAASPRSVTSWPRWTPRGSAG
jgi:hypothetical protein